MGGRAVGKAVYFTRGELITFSYRFNADNSVLNCWMTDVNQSYPLERFALVPVTNDGLLGGFQMKYEDGTCIDFSREPTAINFELREAVLERRLHELLF